MADPTSTETTGDTARDGKTTDPAASSPELAPVMKVTRAKATTSDVPRRATKPKADGSDAVDPPARTGADPGARPANVEIHQGGAETVAGDSVSITQGGATDVTAHTVSIQQGGIVRARADDITVRLGGVALARADRLSIEMGAMGAALTRELHVTQSGVRTIVAQDVRVDQSLVGTTIAGKVTFEKPSAVLLLLAGKTEGPVRAMLDWRGALVFGAVFGGLVGLLRRR